MIVWLRSRSGFLQERPRSDTLFGAICWAVRWLAGEPALVRWLERFAVSDPPFLVSSTFPFADTSTGPLAYLPLPVAVTSVPSGDLGTLEREVAKRLRRKRFVSAPLFSEIIQGRLGGPGLAELVKDEPRDRIENECLGRAADPLPDLRVAEVWRNAGDRLSWTVGGDALFVSRRVGVIGGGLAFLIRAQRDVAETLQGAIRFMADRGIGGDASIGSGACHVEFGQPEPFTEPVEAEALVTLSLWHPSEADLAHLSRNRHRCAYALEKRRGRIENMYVQTSDVWKQALLHLGEGSVVPVDGDRLVYGSAPRVKDRPFPVRHYGFAYPVRMRHAV